jgi:hypothetical protein
VFEPASELKLGAAVTREGSLGTLGLANSVSHRPSSAPTTRTTRVEGS